MTIRAPRSKTAILPAKPSRPAVSMENARAVVEARIVGIEANRRVRARVGGKDFVDIECRCAHGVDLDWLMAAVAVAPVDAEISVGKDGAGSVWAIFPGPEHDDVRTPRVAIAASEEISLACGPSTLTLKRDGTVRMKGRDVTTRGSKVARIQGGTVRMN